MKKKGSATQKKRAISVPSSVGKKTEKDVGKEGRIRGNASNVNLGDER